MSTDFEDFYEDAEELGEMTLLEIEEKGLLLLLEAAKQNALNARGEIIEEETINYSFTWSHTPEGHEFWSRVNSRNLIGARNLIPELFTDWDLNYKPIKKVYETSTNRLFRR